MCKRATKPAGTATPHLDVVAVPVLVRGHLAANEGALLIDVHLIALVQQLGRCRQARQAAAYDGHLELGRALQSAGEGERCNLPQQASELSAFAEEQGAAQILVQQLGRSRRARQAAAYDGHLELGRALQSAERSVSFSVPRRAWFVLRNSWASGPAAQLLWTGPSRCCQRWSP